jgi:nucleoside 2-deoxyribosyltransferase
MLKQLRVYLAGPEVFLPNALDMGARKRAVCAEFGLDGVFPLDGVLELDGLEPRRQGRAIYQTNVDLIRSCDLLIANLTPFRGVSADVGTAFELGFMAALGKPVLAYSNSSQSFRARLECHYDGLIHQRKDGQLAGPDDLAIEDFDMADNLMLHGALPEGGLYLHLAELGEELTDLTAFRQAVKAAASFSSW